MVMKNFIKGILSMIFVFLFVVVMVRGYLALGPIYEIAINETVYYMDDVDLINTISFWSGFATAIGYATLRIGMFVEKVKLSRM